jgi:hypothetical protein
MYRDIVEWMQSAFDRLQSRSSQLSIKCGDFGMWRAYRDRGFNDFDGAGHIVFDFIAYRGQATAISVQFDVGPDDILDDEAFEHVRPWFDKLTTEQKLDAFSWTV